MQDFLTPKQVSNFLQVTEDTVRKWARQGKIEGVVKFGHRTLRIPRESITTFLEKHSHNPYSG
jgi:excisionase family DNA binding protein